MSDKTNVRVSLIELKDIIDSIIPSCPEIDCRTCAERHMKLARKLDKRMSNISVTARIDELESFQWNDAHRHVNTRLAELRSTNKEEG